jgi:hypothetical protein
LIKRVLKVAAAAALIVIAFPAYQLGVALGLWQPLTHPLGVSPQARYVPSYFYGSLWFDCSLDRGRDVDVCRAWDDAGRLIAYGNYRLDGEKRAAATEELRPSGVSGGPPGRPDLCWISLSDGKTLVPVNHAGDPLERFEVHSQGAAEGR